LFALCVTTGAEIKQEQAQKKLTPAAAQPSAEALSQMQETMPGAPHSALAKLAGQYTTATKFFMQPGAPPQESTGEAKLSMTLDGRFLAEESSGTLLGQPIKNFRMLGYNNASKRYEGIWTYTMSTSIMSINGTSKDGGKTITFEGSLDDQSGVKQKLDIVMRQTGDDQFVVELSGKTPGSPVRVTTTYTRKK
jgi:hypothetical protein